MIQNHDRSKKVDEPNFKVISKAWFQYSIPTDHEEIISDFEKEINYQMNSGWELVFSSSKIDNDGNPYHFAHLTK